MVPVTARDPTPQEGTREHQTNNTTTLLKHITRLFRQQLLITLNKTSRGAAQLSMLALRQELTILHTMVLGQQ